MSPYRRLGACATLCFLVLFLAIGAVSTEATPETEQKPAGVCPTQTTSLPMPITLSVGLERPNSPAPDASWAIPVEFTLYPPDDPNTICHQWTLTLDQSGQWSGYISLFTGTYDARLRGVHTLRNVRQNLAITAPMTIDMGTLLEGDANGDNIVDILDFARLRVSYFLEEGLDAGFDPTADFDESGFIDVLDFGLLRGNYFTEGDIPVTTSAESSAIQPTSAITITLSPLPHRFAVDEIAGFDIMANAGSQLVQGADIELYYDPAVVEIVDAAGNPVDAISQGPAFVTVLQNRVDRTRNRILFSAGNFGDTVTGELHIASFYLRGVAPGPAGLSYGSRTAAIDDSYSKIPLSLPSLGSIVVTIPDGVPTYLPLGSYVSAGAS